MKRILFMFFCIMPWIAHCFDVSHFFQAQFAPQEPRFEKAGLTSPSIRTGFGTTRKKDNACGLPLAMDCDDRYTIQTIIFDLTHNFCRGFFITGTLPIYHFKITEKPLRNKFWSASNACLTGGWTINYETCNDLDFIDATIETGFIFPTAEKPWNTWGIPLRGAIAWGLYDWITTGFSGDIVGFFTPKNGRLWDVSWWIKTDHLLRGLSCFLGYTHSNQKQTPVPWSCEVLPFWTMDTFHFAVSYDSACISHPYLPSVEFFFNHVMSGKNCLRTPLWGFSITNHF
jgi:hypothetical protein